MADQGSGRFRIFKKKQKNEQAEMSFLDHLETLRWHILRASFAIIILACIAFSYKEIIFDKLILGPKNPDFWTYRMLCKLTEHFHLSADLCITSLHFNLINTEMSGQFSKHFSVSIIAGLIASIPYVVWEIWRFIKPALKEKEKKYATGFVFFTSALFMVGVLFGYYIITPMSVNFLASYTVSDQVANFISLDSYIGLVTTLTLAAGLIFELPIVIYFLSKIGIITPSFMRTYRRYAVVIILIAAAIVTPTPDIPTQLLVSFPLFLLYEISIFVSAAVHRNKRKAEALESRL